MEEVLDALFQCICCEIEYEEDEMNDLDGFPVCDTCIDELGWEECEDCGCGEDGECELCFCLE